MLAGEVETLEVPTNCLDVLAQQVVAAVAVEPWDANELYELIRGAYPYRDLTAEAFESVLMMISGRFPVGSFQDLKPRISWDRVHNRLRAAARLGEARPGRRGDDPRHGALPALPRRGRAEARRARRGIRPGAPGRRDLRARHRDVADRVDRAPAGRRFPRRGTLGADAVLARRGRREDSRAGRPGRGALPRDRHAPRRRFDRGLARGRVPSRHQRGEGAPRLRGPPVPDRRTPPPTTGQWSSRPSATRPARSAWPS